MIVALGIDLVRRTEPNSRYLEMLSPLNMESIHCRFSRSIQKERAVEYWVGQRTRLPNHLMVERGVMIDKRCPAPRGGSNPRAGIVGNIVDAETRSATVRCTRCDFWIVALPLSDGGVVFGGDQDVDALPPEKSGEAFSFNLGQER